MRVNLPVTNVETKLREDQYLISRTDTKGRIVYANPAFVDVSGFSRDEHLRDGRVSGRRQSDQTPGQ